MREIESVRCSCGGIVQEYVTTDEEESCYGCGRKGCCVTALECDKCHTRFTIALEASEME